MIIMFFHYFKTDNKIYNLIFRIIYFLVLFFIFLGIFYFLFNQIDFITGYTLMEIYSFDDTHVITPYSNNTGFLIDTEFINIRDVCTGWFELAVFLSLILATIDVCWKKRILGAIILIPLFLVFNFTRIYIIIFSLLNYDINFVDILHTLLFKLGLFMFFATYYYVWLKISTTK